MVRRLSRDAGGSTHVLESVIVATIMLSAIAFVATFESAPTSTSAATRTLLKQQAEDALSILYDSPVTNSDFGDNLLSVYLVECLQGTCTNLTNKLNRTLPVGSSYAIYLSNGVDTYPVYVTKEPPGEAVTSKRLVEPRWSYSFTGPSMTVVNNVTDPLVVTTIPVFNSNVITPGGSPLKVIVRGIKHSDASTYTLEAEYATEAYASTDHGLVSAVSLNFLVNRTYNERQQGSVPLAYVPGSYWDRYSETVFQAGIPPCACVGWPSNGSFPYKLRVTESAGVGIPLGTQLTVNIPRGWNATGSNDSHWRVTQAATDWNSSYTSSDVVATLLTPIVGSSVDFTFNATYHGDLLNDYPFHAYLSNGADAEANLIVKADGWPSQTQTFAIPSVVASIPRPMGATETTTWSLAVNIPYNPAANIVISKAGVGAWNPAPPTADAQPGIVDPVQCATGSLSVLAGCAYGDTTISHDDSVATNTAIVIKNITIINEDGAAIFGTGPTDVTPGRLDEGTWTSHGSYLYWEADDADSPGGGHYSTSQGPLNLTFTVKAGGVAGSLNPHQTVVPPAQYETTKGRLAHQLSPGLYREAFLPDQTTGQKYPVKLKGYTTGITDVQHGLNHSYTSDSIYRATAVDGSNHYTDNALSPYHDSLYGSYVNVDKRTIAIGGQVVLTADVQSILYALAQAGQSAGVNLTFYPPWTGDDHVPIWRQENLDSGVTAADVSKLVMVDVTGDGTPDPVVATSTGRILAYDATTGERTQGNTFVAPVSATHGSGAVSAITALEAIHLGTHDYIVVGTDAQSDIYVLDTDLEIVWTFEKPAQTVVAIDTRVDLTGDGRRDIVATLADSTTYVFTADDGDDQLRALHPAGWASPQSEALYQGAGTPSALAALANMGLDGRPGFATSLVEKPGATGTINRNSPNPLTAVNLGITLKAPAAGLELIDSTGALSSTFWGPAVTVARAVDHDGNGVTDVVAGSTSGYVYMLNGARAAQPAAGYIWTPAQQMVDGDVRDDAHAAWLTDDGGIYYTYDGWNVLQCMNCDPAGQYSSVNPALNSVSMTGQGTIWAVGDANLIYSTTAGPDGSPMMVPQPPTSVIALSTSMDVSLAIHDYKSVHFAWGTDDGWIVGTPTIGACGLAGGLAVLCGESVVMRTTDGGANWQTLTLSDGANTLETKDHTMVTATLTRVNFTTPQYGWIVGTSGTLLRSIDSGASFHGIPVPTTEDLTDVACAPQDPDTCLVTGKGGVVLRSTHATTATVAGDWEDISLLVDSTGSRDMNATGFFDASHALVAGANFVWETRDGGDSWTAMPIGGKLGPVHRFGLNTDGSGFAFAGNASNAYFYYFADYRQASSARTLDVTGGALPADAVVDIVNVSAVVSKAAETDVTITVGTDGTFWNHTDIVGVNTPQPVADATGVAVVMPQSIYLANLTLRPPSNHALVKFDFATGASTAESTARVHTLSVEVAYHCTTTGVDGCALGEHTQTYDVGTKDPAIIDDVNTNATWDTTMGQIRNPYVSKFWVSNVSGYVQDIQVGASVTGDAHDDVWVSTGSVLGSNNPDYIALSGTNPDAITGNDDRIYLLDGKNGTIKAVTERLGGTNPGDVSQIRLVDDDNDGIPDYVYAAVDPPTGSTQATGWVYGFYANNLTAIPSDGSYSVVKWATFGVTGLGDSNVSGDERMYWGTLAAPQTVNGKAQISGALFTLRLSDLAMDTRRADTRGTYVVTKEIPSDWLFGPYVAEVAVDWTDNVLDSSGGTPVAREVLQSARFYDYFVVAPPSSISSPSPVYDVHLVTWMDDWR